MTYLRSRTGRGVPESGEVFPGYRALPLASWGGSRAAGTSAMPSSESTEPASRSGGGPAGGGDDLAEEAAGGPGGEVAGGPNHKPGRELAAYLLFPRPEGWVKATIAPACFLLAATGAGHLGNWKRFGVLWLVLEFGIYAARYQWND